MAVAKKKRSKVPGKKKAKKKRESRPKPSQLYLGPMGEKLTKLAEADAEEFGFNKPNESFTMRRLIKEAPDPE